MSETRNSDHARTILVVRFRLDMPAGDYAALCANAADIVAAQPGLERKLWATAHEDRRACGIYVFESRAAAEAYVSGPVFAKLREASIHDLEVELYAPQRELCARTGTRVLLEAPRERATGA